MNILFIFYSHFIHILFIFNKGYSKIIILTTIRIISKDTYNIYSFRGFNIFLKCKKNYNNMKRYKTYMIYFISS